MKKRTQKEIDAEIKWLTEHKQRIPQIDDFGDNNHRIIDAVIQVLQGKLKLADINNGNCRKNAQHTLDWMAGTENVSPSQNWTPLVK